MMLKLSDDNLKNIDSVKDITTKINEIAAKYIVNLSIPDMEGLLDEEFCKNVEVVTSNVFLERVKMHEVDVLVQKTSKGEKINQKDVSRVRSDDWQEGVNAFW